MWFAIVAAYCVTLGWAGLALGIALLVISRLGLTPLPEASVLRREEVIGFILLAGLVIARPWTPTQWDEFVWIAKARLESLGIAHECGVDLVKVSRNCHGCPPSSGLRKDVSTASRVRSSSSGQRCE